MSLKHVKNGNVPKWIDHREVITIPKWYFESQSEAHKLFKLSKYKVLAQLSFFCSLLKNL